MWNVKEEIKKRDETELTDKCKWNLTVGVSRYKLHTSQTKKKVEPTDKTVCVFVR